MRLPEGRRLLLLLLLRLCRIHIRHRRRRLLLLLPGKHETRKGLRRIRLSLSLSLLVDVTRISRRYPQYPCGLKRRRHHLLLLRIRRHHLLLRLLRLRLLTGTGSEELTGIIVCVGVRAGRPLLVRWVCVLHRCGDLGDLGQVLQRRLSARLSYSPVGCPCTSGGGRCFFLLFFFVLFFFAFFFVAVGMM